jgi:hypothetical protein
MLMATKFLLLDVKTIASQEPKEKVNKESTTEVVVVIAATTTTTTDINVAARTMPTELLVEMVATIMPTVLPAVEATATIREATLSDSYPFELP